MAKVLLLNGPNLNLLGEREPDIYGHTRLQDIEDSVRALLEGAGHACASFQSNSEGLMIDWLQENRAADFLLINAGALTHTSIALRDALAALQLPFLEIHISNIYKRESFRHHSFLAALAIGSLVGLGTQGYDLAARFAIEFLKQRNAH
ncbi:MAG: type II 3-dehydroquinate dehydratase [SAR324 cluster bacterium]|nr:type II 3-dehydroquinate dehydratase [SAR324 cluster bacterium]